MRFKLFILYLLVFVFSLPAFAEKIPVKITPAQIISTNNDEIEVGDRINFEIVNNVYINDTLYLQKGTKLIGIVDFVHNNGWGGDSADIIFKKFYTSSFDNNKVIITCPLELNGQAEMANNIRDVTNKGITSVAPRIIPRIIQPLRIVRYQYIPYLGFIFRGAELSIEPDTQIYNIFITH